MTLRSLEGQPRAVETLLGALRTGAVPHAYLFAGPSGVGKEAAAIGLAQALVCEQAPAEGCGECSSCSRVAKRNHPDVVWLMPEEELIARKLAGRSDFAHTPSRDLRVDQIRKLQERIAFKGLESPRKVAILVRADSMNPQAQNALLKTLEEPPADTTLVLIAAAPDKLLPTVRSRCAKIAFGPLAVAMLARKVEAELGVDATTAELIAHLAEGSLAIAKSIDLESLKARRAVIEGFEAMTADAARPWLRFAETYGARRESAVETLRLIALWGRDVLTVKAGLSNIVNRDLVELARNAARRTSEAELHRRHRLIEDTLEQITTRNVSPRLWVERFLILSFSGVAAS